MSKLAWTGELEMLESKWTDKDGHTTKFKLVTPNESRPNPFKVFTKRRGNRAGTRFHAVLTHVGGVEESAYDGQVMLAGWGDTSTQGYTVNFWVEAPEPLIVHHLGEELLVQRGSHPFEGYRRSHDTFMVALVELDDTTDEAIDQTQRNRVEKATGTQPLPDADEGGDEAGSAPAPDERMAYTDEMAAAAVDGATARLAKKPYTRTLANYAAILCDNPDFWAWCNEARPDASYATVITKEDAKEWMCKRLGIDSRKDLDTSPTKAALYHNTIRKPFVEWQEIDEHA